jgi:ribosomal protein L37AE/L43A
MNNPVIPPPVARFQQPVFEQVWTCSRCGAVVGRGAEKPSVFSCPSCGARLSGGAWTLAGTIIGGAVVGLIFLLKTVFKR